MDPNIYASEAFHQFSCEYGFMHATSSPLHSEANGAAARAVRMEKYILWKNTDPYIGILAYQSAPVHNGLSPAQLQMGQELCTTRPVLPSVLWRQVDDNTHSLARIKEQDQKDQQAAGYNRRHRVVALLILEKGDAVWVQDQDQHGDQHFKTSIWQKTLKTFQSDYSTSSINLILSHWKIGLYMVKDSHWSSYYNLGGRCSTMSSSL